MGIIIILFFIATILAFGMLSFRAWEIETLRTLPPGSPRKIIPEMYFRHLEKIMLHLAKHIIQWIVLMLVKGWFILTTKTKKWIGINLPKVYKFFKKKTEEIDQQGMSFVRKAVLESRMKIRRIKEKVKREHEENLKS
jgi:hypothetical protein